MARSFRWFCCIALVLGCAELHAGSPRLIRVTPAGGQRGTTVTVELFGRHLNKPQELLFYQPGITLESLSPIESTLNANGRPVPVEAGTRVRAKLKIAADCPLGTHGFRLRTADGLTDYQLFLVGAYPSLDEDEQTNLARNDKPEQAKSIPVNCTVNGRLNDPADVDLYKLEFRRGQRITAELEAARLGVERGIPDLWIALRDAQFHKLAESDDSGLYLQDPVLSILAPADGVYYLEVRHNNYGGNGEQYRLHVGTFIRPTAVYPAGGPANSALEMTILGDPRGVWKQSVSLPARAGFFDLVAVDPHDQLSAPSPNRLRVSPFGNVLEAEPNDTPPTSASPTTTTPLPIAFNGIINKPGDVDCFTFRAKKGETFRFQAFANAFGSPVDPIIWIKPLNGKPNAPVLRATDARANQLGYAPSNGLFRELLDPILDFTAPADGDYILGVENERGEGGPDFVYRVEAAPESTGIFTYIAPETENQNAPQLRQAIVVAQGNRWTSQIGLFSTNRAISEPLEIVGLNLPEGVSVHAPRIMPGMTRVPVVFEASPSAKPQAALVDLAVRSVKPTDHPFASGYRQTILFNQFGNNDYYLHRPVEKLALAVVEPAPFRLEVEEPKTALVQNGELLLKFRVIRRADFTGPVTVQMDWRPSGVSTAVPTTIAADQSEGTYLLGAARNATAGKYLVTLTGMSGTGRASYNDPLNRSYAASSLFNLTVAEPHLEARIARTSVERGKTAVITCKLNHLQPFSGKAVCTLTRLPRGVELVEPSKLISSNDQEVSFTIRATADALVGNYTGITLDVSVPEGGQTVRQLTGYGQLRIDSERGKPKN